jgi:hypothetical protein
VTAAISASRAVPTTGEVDVQQLVTHLREAARDIEDAIRAADPRV